MMCSLRGVPPRQQSTRKLAAVSAMKSTCVSARIIALYYHGTLVLGRVDHKMIVDHYSDVPNLGA
jgi:hypothetical protein